MAERVDKFPEKAAEFSLEKFADGNVWRFTKEEIGNSQAKNRFRSRLWQYSSRKGLQLKARTIDGDFFVQFLPKETA